MCLHCQNYDISQYPRVHGGKILGDQRDPEAIVAYALGSHSASISYTYTEPTIFFEYAQDVAGPGPGTQPAQRLCVQRLHDRGLRHRPGGIH